METKNIYEKLVMIQSGLKAPKGNYNKFGGYAYRSAEDILEAVKPLLSKCVCVLTISDQVIECGGRIYIQATACLRDGKDTITATAYAREEETKKGMDASQITGSASSYARKYALNGLFAIDDTKDADATNTHGNETSVAQTAQPVVQSAQAQPTDAKAECIDACGKCKSRAEFENIMRKYKTLGSDKDVVATWAQLATKFPKVA